MKGPTQISSSILCAKPLQKCSNKGTELVRKSKKRRRLKYFTQNFNLLGYKELELIGITDNRGVVHGA